MDKIFQIISFLFLISRVVRGEDEYCYSSDKTPYPFFSTLTSYDTVKGPLKITEVSSCKPIYIWALVKHGFPHLTEDQIKRNLDLINTKLDVEQNGKEKRCKLCGEDYQNIIHWYSVIRNAGEELIKKAKKNHEALALTLDNHLNLPYQSLTKDKFEFHSSKSKDAKDSAIAFYNQFLKNTNNDIAGSNIYQNEKLLQLRSECSKWSANDKEVKDFISSSYMQEAMSRVSTRLGNLETITFEKLFSMYESCAYERLLDFNERASFCAAFTPEDSKIFEYLQELKHYWEFGYGNSLSEKMGCPLIRVLEANLTKAATDGGEKIKGSFYFADSEAINGVLTKLGLYRDTESLKYSNFQPMKDTRQWRSSLIDPFTSNIFVVLFNCYNNEKKVEFYHNQNLIQLPGCKGSQKCTLETFKKELNQAVKDDKCDYQFCSQGSSNSNMQTYSLLVIFLSMFFGRL